MHTLHKLILGFSVLLSATISTAHAMTVSPMQVEMNSVGQRATARVSVVNNSNQSLPVEAVVERLSLDDNGKQKTAKAGEDFLIMPPQAMIPPGATQNFRIQWLGDPMLERSQSFMLFLNQLPVKMPKGRSGVQIVTGMGVMINVAPPNATPSLNVVSTNITTDKSGKRFPSITVENPTNAHALLPQSTVHLASGAWSSTLTPSQLGDRIGIGLVQPGRRRKFILPVELPPSVHEVNASIEMTGRRK